jgi:hypothetical protein
VRKILNTARVGVNVTIQMFVIISKFTPQNPQNTSRTVPRVAECVVSFWTRHFARAKGLGRKRAA